MKKWMLVVVLVCGMCVASQAVLTKVNVAAATACGEHHSLLRGPGNLINDVGMDGPGLDALADNNWANQWMSDGNVGVPQHPGTVVGGHWVEFDLGMVYNDLVSMGIWSYNELNYPWFGMKDITIEYSTDGASYSTLFDGTLQPTNGGGVNPSAVDLIVDLTGLSMRYVVITCGVGKDQGGPQATDRNWAYDRNPYYNEAGLGEVRFYTPEPTTMVMFGVGALALIRRRK